MNRELLSNLERSIDLQAKGELRDPEVDKQSG